MRIRRMIAASMAVCLLTGLAGAGPVFGAQELLDNELLADDKLLPGSELLSDEKSDGLVDITPVALLMDKAETDEAIYGNDQACEDDKDRSEEINRILNEKDLMGVLYLCDEYPLRTLPSGDSDTAVSLGCGTTLYLKEAVLSDETYWFLVSAYAGEDEVSGYLPMDKFVCIDEDYLAWEESLRPAGQDDEFGPDGAVANASLSERAIKSVYSFPDSYRDKLFNILNSHPDWVFVPQRIGMTLNDALNAELEVKERNLIYKTANDAYKNGQYNSTWYYVSRTGLAYYMYPANFIGSEQNIFMFEQLTYNGSYHTKAGVQSVLKGTFMSGNIPDEGMTYADAFYGIGSSLQVSPYHLAARVYQEQGKGTSPLISGTYSGYEGYYNFFNIQASGKTNAEIYANGLAYAKKQGWNSRYKSLAGGAAFDSKNYILAGQDTPYLEKYNVVRKVYYHQYMQNVSAPLTESSKVYSMYKNSGALNNPFVFKIPVYDGDPISPDPRTKPTYKLVKDQASNLYYTAGTDEVCAVYTITASEEIKSISLTEDSKEARQNSGKPYYDVLSYDGGTGKLTLVPVGLELSNYSKMYKKAVLDLEFADYGHITYNLNIATQNKVPVIKTGQTTIYGGLERAVAPLTHSGLPADTEVECADDRLTVAFNSDMSGLECTALEGFKGGNKKLTFKSALWRAPIKKTVSVKYIKDPMAAYKFSASGTIKLSALERSYIVYTPKMSSFPSITIEDVSLEGEDSGSFKIVFLNRGELLPNGRKVTAATGVFVLTVRDADGLVPGEKYNFDIRTALSNGLKIAKPVTVRPAR